MLSSFLGYPFLDTDEMIEEGTSEKIATIFEQEGEEAFREMETQVLQVRCHITRSTGHSRTCYGCRPVVQHARIS